MIIPFSQFAYEKPTKRFLMSQGSQAHADGLGLSDNPYERDSLAWRLWAVGWACEALFQEEVRKLN